MHTWVPWQVKQLLRDGGGTREFYVAPLVTHMIADQSPDDVTLAPVKDAPVPVVHSDWVRMSSKCGVQLPTAPYEVNVAKLFSGLVFCLSKLTSGDKEKLCVMVIYYGGKIQKHLDRNVTHLVTMVTTGPKYDVALKHAGSVAMVTPAWVVDSIESDELQDVKGYHPSGTQSIGQEVQGQQELKNGAHNAIAFQLAGDHMTLTTPINGRDILTSSSHIGDQSVAEKVSTNTARPTEDCILLNTNELMKCNEKDEPDMAMEVEDGDQTNPGDNVQVSQDTKTHEQMPDSGVTLAGNDGKLPDNHVTPHVGSETITSGQPLPQSVPQLLRGLVFVVKGYQEHLDEGTVQKWKDVIIQYGGNILENYDPQKVTHLLALHKNCSDFDAAFNDGKCISSAHWLNDVLLEQQLFPPCHALHFPTYFRQQVPGTEQLSITLTNYSGAERELVKDMIKAAGISYTGHLSKNTTHLICKMPFGKKYERACEWNIKVVNASFLSEIIHNGQIPAILYPRHTKLGSPDEFSAPFYEAMRLLKPWQSFIAEYASRSPQWVNQESTQKAFSVLAQSKEEQGVCEMMKSEPALCRSLEESHVADKPTSLPNAQHLVPCVVFTGINVQLLGHLKKIVLKLGGKVTESVHECTHLVATRIARTVKFLCGISVCEHVVMPHWLDQCNAMNKFVDETPYVLRDQEAEDLFNMSVSSSLLKAKQTPLLTGQQVFSTLNVSPPHESLKDIIQCAGGELLDEEELRNRFGRTLEHVDQNHPLLVISCHEDVQSGLCNEFFAKNIAVYNPEFILTGVLRQQLDYNQNQLSQPNQQ